MKGRRELIWNDKVCITKLAHSVIGETGDSLTGSRYKVIQVKIPYLATYSRRSPTSQKPVAMFLVVSGKRT
jgi:hypothetical protein